MNRKLLLLLGFCSFFEVQAQTFSSGGSVTVPDGVGVCLGGAPALSSFTVSGAGISATTKITDPSAVTIRVNPSHSGGFSADMTLELIAPNGSSVYLINRPSANTTCAPATSGTFIAANTLSFNSSFTTPVPIGSPTPAGNYKPTAGAFYPAPGALDTFLTGKTVAGVWSIRAIDNYNGFGTGTISSWSIDFGATALPLNLLSFMGKSFEKYNLLMWQTAAEKNTARFELERSSDGIDYTPIATIAAKKNVNNTYDIKDNNLTDDMYMYRLKMIDQDGQYSYSNTLKISTEGNENTTLIEFSPNPTKEILNINLIDKNLLGSEVKILNYKAQVMQAHTVVKSDFQLNVGNYPSGIYVILFESGQWVKFTKLD